MTETSSAPECLPDETHIRAEAHYLQVLNRPSIWRKLPFGGLLIFLCLGGIAQGQSPCHDVAVAACEQRKASVGPNWNNVAGCVQLSDQQAMQLINSGASPTAVGSAFYDQFDGPIAACVNNVIGTTPRKPKTYSAACVTEVGQFCQALDSMTTPDPRNPNRGDRTITPLDKAGCFKHENLQNGIVFKNSYSCGGGMIFLGANYGTGETHRITSIEIRGSIFPLRTGAEMTVISTRVHSGANKPEEKETDKFHYVVGSRVDASTVNGKLTGGAWQMHTQSEYNGKTYVSDSVYLEGVGLSIGSIAASVENSAGARDDIIPTNGAVYRTRYGTITFSDTRLEIQTGH